MTLRTAHGAFSPSIFEIGQKHFPRSSTLPLQLGAFMDESEIASSSLLQNDFAIKKKQTKKKTKRLT